MKRYIRSMKVIPTYVCQLTQAQQDDIRRQLESYDLTPQEVQDAMDSKISDITGNPECPIIIKGEIKGTTIMSDFNAQTSEYYPAYANYKVVSYDDYYEQDVHYFQNYHDALNYGNAHYNGQCDIEEI